MKLNDMRKDIEDIKKELSKTTSLKFWRKLCPLIKSKVPLSEIASLLESKKAEKLLKKRDWFSMRMTLIRAFELCTDEVYVNDLINLLIRCGLKPAEVSAKRILLLLMNLISDNCPLTGLQKILDFVDEQPWKDNVYHSTLLPDLLYKINEEKDLFTGDENYTLSLLELLVDRGYSLAGIHRSLWHKSNSCTGISYKSCIVSSKLILRQPDLAKIKNFLEMLFSIEFQFISIEFQFNGMNTIDKTIPKGTIEKTIHTIIDKLISQINSENAARLREILVEVEMASTLGLGSEILDTLQNHYCQQQDQMLKNTMSDMIAGFMHFHLPMGKGRHEAVNLSIFSAFRLRQDTQYYFGQLSKVITAALEPFFIPTVLIQLLINYLNLPSLISAISGVTPPPEHKDMRYKLSVQRQADHSSDYYSDCGAHALTNALSGAAFITENFNLLEAIIKNKPVLADDEKSTLLEKIRHQIIEKAEGFRQGDNHTSPIVMRELIQQDSKLLKIIRDFNDTDPTLVLINIEDGAHIGAFDALMQLQMLNNIIRIFDRLQQGLPVGGYPFLIFVQHHWITALCFGRLFLMCDSYDENPHYLSEICKPIQEAITCADTLKTHCKTILTQAYEKFTFFGDWHIQSPELASRQITDLFRVWLSIASNIHLRSVLEKNDALKFKLALDLSNALKLRETPCHLTEKHTLLVSDLLKNSTLFSRVTGTFPTRFRIDADTQITTLHSVAIPF